MACELCQAKETQGGLADAVQAMASSLLWREPLTGAQLLLDLAQDLDETSLLTIGIGQSHESRK